MTLISDPLFYLAAIPAVFLVGLSKGGFGGTLAMLGVPIMALVISPLQAAGIMLPILIVMDIVALVAYRGRADWQSLSILLPASVAGITIGWATATYVNDDVIRLLLGIMSLAFVGNYVLYNKNAAKQAPPAASKGIFWGGIAGFTSFVSHSGGPPFQMYLAPRRLAPTLFQGTAVVFFAFVNAVKLVPYFYLDQFDRTNLTTSASLFPIALAATLCGVWLVKRIKPEVFYSTIFIFMAIIGIKITYDGIAGLMMN